MMLVFLLHLALSYEKIPDKFKLLKQKAQQSVIKRKSMKFDIEEPIYPGKPYISDMFNGTVRSMVFGTTVPSLKGYAFDDDNHYMALISNRKTVHGTNMIKQPGIFFDKDSQKIFKLHDSIVDDGDVAIYNITEIEFFEVFDRFRAVLPAFSNEYNCGGPSHGFGGVCKAQCLYNWNDKEDMAAKVEIPGVPDKFKEKAKIYAGVMGTAEASVVVSKNGVMALQAQLVGDVVLKGGVGFHVNNYKWSKEKIALQELPIKIIDYSKSFFGISFSINLDIILAASLENFSFEIPHDINYMKEFRAELKSGITVSNKEKTLTDFDKSFIIYDSVARSKKLDDPGNISASLSTSLVLKAAFSLRLKASSSDFHIETGLKNKFNLTYKSDSVKCTFPPLSGNFVYQLLAYIEFGGTIKIFGHQIWSNSYYYDKLLFERPIMDESCIFSPGSSDEVNPDLIDQSKKQLTLYILENVSYTDESSAVLPIFFLNNYDDDNSLLKPIYQSSNNAVTNIILHNDQKFDSFDFFSLILKDKSVNTYVDWNQTLPTDSPLSYSYMDGKFTFDMERKSTNSRSMFKEFKFNIDDIVNTRPDMIYPKSERLAVIIHSTDTSYIVDNSLFDSYCESEIEAFKAEIHLRKWFKLSITGFSDTDTENKALIFYQSSKVVIVTVAIKELDFKYIYSVNPFYWMIQDDVTQNTVIGIIRYGTLEVEVPYGDLSKAIDNGGTLKIDLGTANMDLKVEMGYPDMIFTFHDDERFSEKNNLRAIITRSFETDQKTGNRLKWNGKNLSHSIEMDQGEQYGVIKYLFDYHGQDLNYTYILMSMTSATPLCRSKKKLDKGLYLVKLELDFNLFEKENNEYEITIPFRKKVKAKATIDTDLYMIFQAQEENDHDPFCSFFPTFKMANDPEMYVGCIKNYIDKNNIADNSWYYYPTDSDKRIEPFDYPNTEDNLIRVHGFHFSSKEAASETEIAFRQKYILFPNNYRYVAVNNDTINSLLKYSAQKVETLDVKCERCGDMLYDDLPGGSKLGSNPSTPGYFYAIINENTKNFNIFAVCKDKTDAFCGFIEDFSNDGNVLLKYTHTSSDPNENYGVEEIVDYDYSKLKDTTLLDPKLNDETLLDPGCSLQIISNRGKASLTKNWFGRIERVLTKISDVPVSCEATAIDDYVSLKLLIGKTQIPFSRKKFVTDNDDAFKDYMSQFGVKAESFHSITDNQLHLDHDGSLIVHKDLFDKKKFKENDGKKITMIDLPEYSYYGGTYKCINLDNLSTGAIIGIAIACVVALVAIAIVIKCCLK